MRSMVFVYLLFIFLMFQPRVVLAELGGSENNINNEEKHFKAKSHKKTQRLGYSVHELVLEGIKVKEFVSLSGTIFAVSWRGMTTPDLKVLFGNYYTEYEKEKASIKIQKGRRSVGVATTNIVVNHGGQMRDMRGFAYVPAVVPAGLDLNTLE